MQKQVCYAIKNNWRLRKCLTIRKRCPNARMLRLRACGASRDCAQILAKLATSSFSDNLISPYPTGN